MKQEVCECVGLYLGDGLKSMKNSSMYRLSFTNCNLELILKMKHFFISMGIPNSKVYAQIDVPIGDDAEKVKRKVISKIKIRYLNAKTRVAKRKKPAVQIRAFSKEIRKKLNNLIEGELKNINRKKAVCILRGIFAAEGRVKLQKKSLNAICIATSEDKNYRLIELLFKKLGFKYYYSHNEFYFHGIKQFERFRKLKIHILHSDKKEKFENAHRTLRGNLGLSDISPGATAE